MSEYLTCISIPTDSKDDNDDDNNDKEMFLNRSDVELSIIICKLYLPSF